MKQTLQGVLDSFQEDPEKIAEMLAFKSRFWNYSLNNSILIQLQNPFATFVASIHDWNKKGYRVKKGQHGIKVIIPIRTELIPLGLVNGEKRYRRVADATPEQKQKIKNGELKTVTFTRFGVGTVFDIAQTDCPPQDYPKYFNMGYSSDQHKALYDSVKQYAQQKGIPVKEEDLQSISLRGAFYPDENVIRINDKLNDTERLSTLTHELGHALMHNNKEAFDLPEPVRELEADAVSIMLQQYFGISLTDSRKRHFSENYKACAALKDFKLEDALKLVNTTYQELRKELEPMLPKSVPVNAKEQEKGAEAPGKKILQNLLRLYPNLKENAGYYILDETRGYALGFNPKAPEALVVWRADGNGGYVNGEYRHTIDSYDLRDLVDSGFNPDAIQKMLDEVGYSYETEPDKEPQLAELSRRLSEYPLPDSLNKMQQAALRRAVKHTILNGEKDGQKYLNEFYASWANKEIPVSQEVQNSMNGIFVHMMQRFSPDNPSEALPSRPEAEVPNHSTRYAAYADHDNAVLNYIKHSVSIISLAQTMGFTPVQDGHYYTLKEHDSVKIYPETNSFCQFSSGKGGSPIDFLMTFGGYTAKEAIEKLEKEYTDGRFNEIHAVPQSHPAPVPEKKEFVLPEKVGGKYTHAFAYLTKTRCLDADIVKRCMSEGLIYEDKKHNVVFVGKDDSGQQVYATRHTTLTESNFKRDVAGSRQDVGWMVKNGKAEKLYVCEAPIDALSIMTLLKQQGKSIAKASFLATCGTCKDAALYARLRANPQIKEVSLANDNDEAGQKANEKIYKALQKDFPGIRVKLCTPNTGKDINEYLCKKPKKEAEKEQEVER